MNSLLSIRLMGRDIKLAGVLQIVNLGAFISSLVFKTLVTALNSNPIMTSFKLFSFFNSSRRRLFFGIGTLRGGLCVISVGISEPVPAEH